METKKGSRKWLVVALVLLLIGMVGASLVQSSGGKVRIEHLKLYLDKGYRINAVMYIPKGASADHKLPLIVAQHGLFNNLQMQDLNLVELSRRGFIVIAPDMYGHGSSSVMDQVAPADQRATQIHIIEYAWNNLKMVDTSKIAVMGHSMGGMTSNATFKYYQEQAATGKGVQKVAAVLDVGADGQYKPYTFKGIAEPVVPEVNWGIIQGKYDEFFFRQPDAGGDVRRFLESKVAQDFVNQVGANVSGPVPTDKVYKGEIKGKPYIRVIYQNTEIHPKNHFSMMAAADTISYFYDVFGVPAGFTRLDPGNQTWQWKEFFNFVGLVGIFLFLFPFASLVIDRVPFFSELKAARPAPTVPALKSATSKAVFWIIYIVNIVIPALLVMPVMYSLVGKKQMTPNMSAISKWFGEGNTNELAAWTVVVGICLLAVFLLVYFLYGKKNGATTESWGVRISGKAFWKSVLLAFMTVGIAYVILGIADLFFATDFRVWMIAMRTFTVDKIPYFIAYVPAFALFYLVNSLLVEGGNRSEGMPRWFVTLISCFANLAGIGTLVFIQYYGLVYHGTEAFNHMRIVNLFPLLVLIPAATFITRRYFRKTGTIYLGAFTISILYCMMTVANTSFISSILP